MWNITGDQGNQWLRADIDLNLPSAAVNFELLIDAYTSGANSYFNKGDIAIDDISIKTDGTCDQNSGWSSQG